MEENERAQFFDGTDANGKPKLDRQANMTARFLSFFKERHKKNWLSWWVSRILEQQCPWKVISRRFFEQICKRVHCKQINSTQIRKQEATKNSKSPDDYFIRSTKCQTTHGMNFGFAWPSCVKGDPLFCWRRTRNLLVAQKVNPYWRQ